MSVVFALGRISEESRVKSRKARDIRRRRKRKRRSRSRRRRGRRRKTTRGRMRKR